MICSRVCPILEQFPHGRGVCWNESTFAVVVLALERLLHYLFGFASVLCIVTDPLVTGGAEIQMRGTVVFLIG